jgi:hypothetical protein
MTFPNEEIIVIDLAGDYARVRATSLSKENELKNLGFIEADDHMVLRLDSTEARIGLTRKPMDLDALFSIGPGWSPAELTEHYREQGLISRSYRVIAWKSPEHYSVADR